MNGEAGGPVERGEGMDAEAEDGGEPGAAAEDGELKITIRKLELPVCPRGVLAE